MGGDDEALQSADRNIVHPYITLADLEKVWIGIGAAIDWITMRGKPLTLERYRKREDEAAEALVAALADMPQKTAEAIVRGADQGKPGPLTFIPSGIWPRTATSDSNDSGKLYRLIGADDANEWDGAILSSRVFGYNMVQIRADFIRDNWPEHEEKTTAPSARHVVSQAQLRRVIEMICSNTTKELAPLTQKEVIELVKRLIPSAPRDIVRRIYKELLPNQKPGPRGPRNSDRQKRIQELSEKLIAAQLHN